MNKLSFKLSRRIDINRDSQFIKCVETHSLDNTIYYEFSYTESSSEYSWAYRYIEVKDSNVEISINKLLEFSLIESASIVNTNDEMLDISDNVIAGRCLRTCSGLAGQYWDAADIWGAGYAQAVTDSSAMFCFNLVAGCAGTSSSSYITGLVDSTVTFIAGFRDPFYTPEQLTDSTHYLERAVYFPTRSVAPNHSLQRYKVSGVESRVEANILYIAAELTEDDDTVLSSTDALYNLGIRSGIVSDGIPNTIFIAGICHHLHWSANSIDGLCIDADYEKGEMFIPGTSVRSNSLGWNIDGVQGKSVGIGQSDSTVNVGFEFDGLTSYPVERSRMVFGSQEGSGIGLFHPDLGGDGDSTHGVYLYNLGLNSVFVNNARKILYGDDLLGYTGQGYSREHVEDWSIDAGSSFHVMKVFGIVGGRWNDSGTLGVAPGCHMDPECVRGYIFELVDYGVADVYSYSLESSYLSDYGTLTFYDVVGDTGAYPIGSVANSLTAGYAASNDAWYLVPAFGNGGHYINFDSEIIGISAFSVWDGTSPVYSHGEALTFVSPVPQLIAGPYYDPNGATLFDSHSYGEYAGQSCATPAAAGGMLLLKEARPELSYFEAKNVLASSCRKFPDMTAESENWHHQFGYGRPDMLAAFNTDTTETPCAPPRGLIVDGVGRDTLLFRWTNPHYKHFEKVKILRKDALDPGTYDTFANLHSLSIEEQPEGIGQEESLEWVDTITTSPLGLSVTDSTYFGKVQLYFDFWGSSSYISTFSHNGMAEWNTTYYDLISAPGDTTSNDFPTGMPEVYFNYGGTAHAAMYVIDSTGDWFGYFIDHIRTTCEYFYDQGNPLYGIFLDDFANVISWSYIVGPEKTKTYDRNGAQNDSSHIFITCPELWSYYMASDYYPIWGDDNWEEMTKTEQKVVTIQWYYGVMNVQMESLEQQVWDIINNYCIPDGKMIVNGIGRRLDEIGGGHPTYGNWVPRYGTTRLFEAAAEFGYSNLEDMVGDDGTGSDYYKSRYCHPGDQLLVYCLGPSRTWGDWSDDSFGEGERNLQLIAELAEKRNASVGVGYAVTPFDGGTRLSALFDPNDVDDRWPGYISPNTYMTNHTDGDIVYEGNASLATDSPDTGDYRYYIFSKDVWENWSSSGIEFAFPSARKETEVTFTVSSYSFYYGSIIIYGTLSPETDFDIDPANGETFYNDSTAVPPLSPGGLPHGSGWYLEGSRAREIYPIRYIKMYGEGDTDRGKVEYVSITDNYIDSDTLYEGLVLNFKYLSLNVGNTNALEPHKVRTIEDIPYPKPDINVGKNTWHTTFDPYVDATAVYDSIEKSIQFYIGNIRNPMGITDIEIYRYDGENPTDSDWPERATYTLGTDSTSIHTFKEVSNYLPITSYKIVPISVYGVESSEPFYLLNITTNPINPPSVESGGVFANFASLINMSHGYDNDIIFNVRKNGTNYATGVLSSNKITTFYDIFWQEGDTYDIRAYYDGYWSEYSVVIEPVWAGIQTANTNLGIEDVYDHVTLGNSTWDNYFDVNFNLQFTAATNKLGTFKIGQPVWSGTVGGFQYRTVVVPLSYGGKTQESALAVPQFEFWNSQAGGEMLYRFEVNPIEFEFEFGVQSKRMSTLDGPDKLQLKYQDHVLRSMVWRNIPLQRYAKLVSILKTYINGTVWLDAKDFTMPVKGEFPFVYAGGYRYQIQVVDVIIKPIDGKGVQRGDVELKYKLITSSDSGVI